MIRLKCAKNLRPSMAAIIPYIESGSGAVSVRGMLQNLAAVRGSVVTFTL